jgi:hypothetical protein
MKHILSHFINEDEKPKSGLSDKWKANCIRLLKKGKTLNDESLSNMGYNDTIVKYFPMANPDWRPKKKDVEKYILNNPQVKQNIISQANSKLKQLSNTPLVNSTYSKRMPSWKAIDFGYLNVKYNVTLVNAKIDNFTGGTFTGTGNLNIGANIPDGLFKGLKVSFKAKARIKMSFTPTLGKENVVATFKPLSANVNTSKFNASGSLTLFAAVAAIAGLIPGLILTYLVKFFVKNNVLKATFKPVLKNYKMPELSMWTIPVLTYIKKALGPDIKFSIPRNEIRIAAVPDTPAQVKKIVSKIKVG